MNPITTPAGRDDATAPWFLGSRNSAVWACCELEIFKAVGSRGAGLGSDYKFENLFGPGEAGPGWA